MPALESDSSGATPSPGSPAATRNQKRHAREGISLRASCGCVAQVTPRFQPSATDVRLLASRTGTAYISVVFSHQVYGNWLQQTWEPRTPLFPSLTSLKTKGLHGYGHVHREVHTCPSLSTYSQGLQLTPGSTGKARGACDSHSALTTTRETVRNYSGESREGKQ